MREKKLRTFTKANTLLRVQVMKKPQKIWAFINSSLIFKNCIKLYITNPLFHARR